MSAFVNYKTRIKNVNTHVHTNKCSLAGGKRLGIIRSECVWNEFKWNGGLFYLFLFSVSGRLFPHRIYRRTTSELSGEERKDGRTIRREKIKKNKKRREKGLKTSPNVEKRWNKKKNKRKKREKCEIEWSLKEIMKSSTWLFRNKQRQYCSIPVCELQNKIKTLAWGRSVERMFRFLFFFCLLIWPSSAPSTPHPTIVTIGFLNDNGTRRSEGQPILFAYKCRLKYSQYHVEKLQDKNRYRLSRRIR